MWYKTLFFLLCTGCLIRPLYDSSPASGGGAVFVESISEREGQVLREYLQSGLDSLNVSKHRYVLSVDLNISEKAFAVAEDGNARRVFVIYSAHIDLKDENYDSVLKRTVTSTTSNNVSSAQGEVFLSLYGRNSNAVLKELSARIIENIKAFLLNEN